MSDDRFVTEAELAEAKQKRQEEWEKVRKPEEPKEAPEPESDNRPLFERLREQREKLEMEKTEEKRFKNLVRGLDDEEISFLDMVDNMKEKEQKDRLQEEKRLLKEIEEVANQQQLEASIPSVSAVLQPPTKKTPSAKPNKQALLLSAAVKRKSGSTEGTTKPDSASNNTGLSPPACKKVCQVISTRPSATLKVGLLPGIITYSSSDSEGDSSSSDSSEQSDSASYSNAKCASSDQCCPSHDKKKEAACRKK